MTGVTEIETSAGVFTTRVVAAEIEPTVAVTVTEPVPELVAIPLLPVALLMIATCADELLQVAAEVTSCVEPSV